MSLKLNTTVSLENPGINAIQDVSIDSLSAIQEVSVDRNIHAKSSLDPIPMATETKLGGIKAATKDNTYIDEVKINTSNGKLYTKKIADKVSDLENDSNFQTDTQVEAKVNEEAILRVNADNILQTNITNESTRATTAEQNLSQSISTETSNRTSADNTLQANINAEASARQNADAGKLDKTSTANKIYGTDSNGAQTTYDKDSFGQIDDIKFKENSVVTNKIGIIPKDLSAYDNDSNFQNETQVTSFISAHNNEDLETVHPVIREFIEDEIENRELACGALSDRLDEVEELIPSQASSSNQLGDKAFINSSIENMAAFHVTKRIGSGTQEDPYQFVPFDTKAELLATTVVYIDGVAKNPGKNDYAIVLEDESKQGTSVVAPSTKYRYPKSNTESYDPSCWEYMYPINNTRFTAAQVAAINSGITSTLVSEISLNTTVRHSHSNKSLLDSYTQTEANLADAVSKKHSHSNKALLDTYDQTNANLSDAVSKKHSHSNKSVLDNLTQDVIDNSHSHSNKTLLDSYTQTEANLADAVSKKHSHSNKTVLDGISAQDILNWNEKDVLVAVYDETSDQEILNAVNAGKVVVAKHQDKLYMYGFQMTVGFTVYTCLYALYDDYIHEMLVSGTNWVHTHEYSRW